VKPIGQHTVDEASQKVHARERALAAALGGEGHAALVRRAEARVGDADPMGVPPEVGVHLLGAAEGRLGVYACQLVPPARRVCSPLGALRGTALQVA